MSRYTAQLTSTRSLASARLPNHPKGYQPAVRMPVVEMAAVVALLPRLRCGQCGARLWIEPPTLTPGYLYCPDCGRSFNEVVERLTVRATLTGEDAKPRRGRPPKASQDAERERQRQKQQHYRDAARETCPDCTGRLVSVGRLRCRPCAARRRRTDLTGRLLDLLRSSHGLRSRHIAAILECHPDTVRALVRRARKRGAPIVTDGKRYRLGDAA